MTGQLVSTPVSGFHIGEGTDVEPAHFWSQGPLVNVVRSWQLITKHDKDTSVPCPDTYETAPVSGFHIGEGTDVELAHFWSQGPLVNGVRSWQLILKHDLTHRFHGRTLGVATVSGFCGALMWKLPTSGDRINL